MTNNKPKAITEPIIRRWSISQAMKEGDAIGIHISRPTVISLCRKYGVGYQSAGQRGWWTVYADKYMALIKGDLEI